jgi:hypothetical protein
MLRWVGAIFFGIGLFGSLVALSIAAPNEAGDLPTIVSIHAMGVILCVALIYIRSVRLKGERLRNRLLAQSLLENLSAGRPANPQKALLRAGEIAFLAAPAALLENQTVGCKTSGASVRVRVAKGVSVGSYAGRSRPVSGAVRTAHGEFVVTTRRVIFAGDTKSFEIRLKRLTNVVHYSDRLVLHHGTTHHRVVFGAEELATVAATVLKLALKGNVTVETVSATENALILEVS